MIDYDNGWKPKSHRCGLPTSLRKCLSHQSCDSLSHLAIKSFNLIGSAGFFLHSKMAFFWENQSISLPKIGITDCILLIFGKEFHNPLAPASDRSPIKAPTIIELLTSMASQIQYLLFLLPTYDHISSHSMVNRPFFGVNPAQFWGELFHTVDILLLAGVAVDNFPSQTCETSQTRARDAREIFSNNIRSMSSLVCSDILFWVGFSTVCHIRSRDNVACCYGYARFSRLFPLHIEDWHGNWLLQMLFKAYALSW